MIGSVFMGIFWIGFAVGTAASCLILIAGISAIGWGVGKERSKAADQSRAMTDYWKESLEIQRNNSYQFEYIAEAIRNK